MAVHLRASREDRIRLTGGRHPFASKASPKRPHPNGGGAPPFGAARFEDHGQVIERIATAQREELEDDFPSNSPIKHLHELAIHSALRQKTGCGESTQTECDISFAQVESDLGNGAHERVSVSWQEVFATARTLSNARGVRTPCCSLDTLHVAMALELGATEFCTLSLRLSRNAKAAGLDGSSPFHVRIRPNQNGPSAFQIRETLGRFGQLVGLHLPTVIHGVKIEDGHSRFSA